ncbi:MAG: YjjI family glycine radical enzyme [Traorella sp.]
MEYSRSALDIIQDKTLTYHQQLVELAKLGESTDSTIYLDPNYLDALHRNIICDLNEGAAPYRPRYNCPDYELLFEKGCKFLELDPPKDIWEATNTLLIFYHNDPTGSSYPCYLGNIDTLLDPFIKDEEEARKAIRLFLLAIDKTMPDSFVHANIGPKETKAGHIILDLTEEMQLAVPNLTLKYNETITSDEFAKHALRCMLKSSKPSFANDEMFKQDLGERYGIASCYNGFNITGGAYTMNRLRLSDCAKEAKDIDDFFDRVLPYYSTLMIENMKRRAEFLVEDSTFFKNNFLVEEGFLKRENFVCLFGLAGLAECCNTLLHIEDKTKGFGHNEEANQLGVKILDKIVEISKSIYIPYSENRDNRAWMHAQVGIDSDGLDCSPGTRIPVGAELPLFEQIMHSTLYHKYFPTGTGDIYRFDETWMKNLDALLDVVKGGIRSGVRYFSGYEEGGDLVRVTGYLVKKSELEKLERGEASHNSATVLGVGQKNNAKALTRKLHTMGE